MNRKQQSVVLAGMLAFALAGCSSMRGTSTDDTGGTGASSSGSSMGSGTSSSGSTSSSMGSGTSSMDSGASSSTTPGSEGGAGSTAGTGSSASQQSQSPSTPGAPAGAMSTPNAVVVAIEAMPRQGTGAVGGSGTGTTGSSMGEDKMYRVTLRMDDGTTKVVTQATAPTFRMGDRVNMTDGMISH